MSVGRQLETPGFLKVTMESTTSNDGDCVNFDWREHVVDIERAANRQNLKFKCAYCQKTLTGGRTRLMDHFLGVNRIFPCVQCPPELLEHLKSDRARKELIKDSRKRMESDLEANTRAEKAAKLRELAASFSSGHERPVGKMRQSTLGECEGAALLQQAQETVARMWYATASPFHSIAFPEVVDAFDTVCAYGAATGSETFPLPSAPSLRNHLLEKEVARIEGQLHQHKEATSSFGMSLQSDGKDNVASRHLVNILTTTPMGSEFREVIDVSGQSRDAEHTARLLVDAAKRLKDASELVTIITDTPSVNRAAWRLIEQDMPNVSCVPCGAHCMNLHLKHAVKLIPEFEQWIDQCKTVVFRFANVDFARELLG